MRGVVVVLAGLAAGSLAVACGGTAAPAAGVTRDTIVAEALATIGTLEGDPEYLFGEVESVAADTRGTVYVADRLGSSVRAYTASGAYLGTVGTEGDGPGEFRWQLELTIDDADRLLVRDRTRLTVFDRAAGSAFADSVVATVPLSAPPALFTRSRADGDRYYASSYYYFMFVNHRYFYVVLDSLGLTGDTIPVPSIPDPAIFGRANYPVADGQGGMPVEGVNLAPFEAAPRWAIADGGHVLVSPGDRYEVVEWDADGDTVRVARFETARRPVDPRAARDSARAFGERLDSIPTALEEVRGMSAAARSRTIPDALPEVLALQVDAAGRIWVRRWPGAAGETVFDVLDGTGSPLHTVRVPTALTELPIPWVSPELVVGVVRDPLTEVQRAAVFRIPG